MNSHRSLLALSLGFGFGLVQMGCMAFSDEDVSAVGTVGVSMLNSTSGGGTNGASSVDVADSIEALWNVGDAPFGEQNDEVIKIQASSTGTRNLLSYVVACALPVGYYAINGVTYAGKGLLNSTSSWESAALSTQAKYDLVACVMAHVNPYDLEVPIRLTGQAVADTLTSGQASEFSRPEALWVVYEDALGTLVREVWPFPTPSGACAFSPEELDARVCDDFAGEARCGVTFHADMENHCTQSVATGHWSCDGHPAIQTWLKPNDIGALYPGCAP